MSNLGRSAAEWKALVGEELAGLILAPMRELRELEDKFTLERTQIRNLGDRASATPHITALTLSGVVYGTNTSADGKIYVRFVVDGSGWDVNIYKATGGGGGDLVAHVDALAASGTAALVADNSSGLSGSITLGATITGDTSDNHVLEVVVDYPARLPMVLTQDGTVEDDQFSRRDLQAAYAEVAGLIRQAKARLRAVTERWALASAGNPVARGNAFTGTSYTVLASDGVSEDSDGNVTRTRTGWFYFLKDAMEDEGTGGEQDVVRRVLAAGAGSFDSGNDGSGTVSSHTPLENALPGTWVFECSDATLGAERFSYLFTSTDSTVIERGTAGPVVGQQWSGPRGFGPITVTRTLTKSNDGSNNVFAATSGCTVTGENSSNTNDGDIYVSTTANGSNWDISFYKASSRHSSTLVAKATNVAASAAFTATPQNASGLTIAWTLGGTVSAVSNVTLSLNPFKAENANGVPDKFTVAVTLSAGAGLIQTILAEEFGAFLNSDTSGSESISDGCAKAGTFTAYLVQDN